MTGQSLPVILTDSGTGILDIASIAASANFGQTNTCGPTLAPRANCTISVTFTPNTAGKLNGTLSLTDNASDSPQKSLPQRTWYKRRGLVVRWERQCPPQCQHSLAASI